MSNQIQMPFYKMQDLLQFPDLVSSLYKNKLVMYRGSRSPTGLGLILKKHYPLPRISSRGYLEAMMIFEYKLTTDPLVRIQLTSFLGGLTIIQTVCLNNSRGCLFLAGFAIMDKSLTNYAK